MPTLGVAIPCYHGHISILKNLLDSIQKQTRKPDMVVISCSGATDSDIPYTQEQYSFSLRIITNPNKLNAAQNRNIAATALYRLNTDIISFVDADDQIHFQRLEIIEKAFIENNIVLLLHNFIIGYDMNDTQYDKIVFDINKIGIQADGNGTVHITKPSSNIANGHCTIDKNVLKTIKWREGPEYHGREDSIFTSDIIKTFPNRNAYCPHILSKYIPSCTGSYVT
jgi:glycosyltransferase involved in cell wall biosynthesis